NLVGGNQPRSQAAGPRKIFSRRPLRSVTLPVAKRRIVEASVPGDVLQSAILGDVAAALADDYRQLRFVVKVLRDLGPDQRLTIADQRARKANEEAGKLRLRSPRLLPVRVIIEPYAENLFRVGYHRPELNFVEAVIGLLLKSCRASAIECVLSQDGAKAGK